MRETLKNYRRIAVKAGTSILSSREGRFSPKHLAQMGNQILKLSKKNKEVVLVSSGAIALGMEVMGFEKRPSEMSRLQACAAIGQGKLMHAYEQFFSKANLQTAQVLLTRDGLESHERFLKARQTLEELLRFKVLPIVNENDTVATDEIKFGDNDILSVQVGHLVHADLLVILSDVDGFFLRDGSRVRQVSSEQEIDQELVKHLKDTKKQKNVGGMRAKLEAARVAMRLGLPLLMVNGHVDGIVEQALAGEDVGTIFLPSKKQKNERKKWIAFSAARRGALTVDAGAYEALQEEKGSLLAKGILRLAGNFNRGDVVELLTLDGKVFGRGVAGYSAEDLKKIAGNKSGEIKNILGYKYQDEVIHRNDLVVWG